MKLAYNRILLKLSGETLSPPDTTGLEGKNLADVANEIAEVAQKGVKTGIVIGGGNLFRGALLDLPGVDRVRGDYMGMIATIINSIALSAALNQAGAKSRVLSAIEIPGVVQLFNTQAANDALDNNEVVVFAAGTGNPFFTTDTAASLRGIQISADALVKATKVDGVFDKDPKVHDDAVRFPKLTYSEVLQKNLKVMDAAAVSMCRDNELPIIVFDFFARGNLMRVISGEDIGTTVRGKE